MSSIHRKKTESKLGRKTAKNVHVVGVSASGFVRRNATDGRFNSNAKTSGRTTSASRPASASTAPYRAVFRSREDYDRSVEDVVTRIKNGQVQARTPDE